MHIFQNKDYILSFLTSIFRKQIVFPIFKLLERYTV